MPLFTQDIRTLIARTLSEPIYLEELPLEVEGVVIKRQSDMSGGQKPFTKKRWQILCIYEDAQKSYEVADAIRNVLVDFFGYVDPANPESVQFMGGIQCEAEPAEEYETTNGLPVITATYACNVLQPSQNSIY